MKTNFPLFLFILVFFSCKENNKNISFDYNAINTIEVPEYLTDLGKDSIIHNISYLRLETKDSCLIGRISQLLSDSSYLFVIDKEEGNLLEFNKNGKFLKKIGRKGVGRGFYSTLDHVTINKESNELNIIDIGRKKVLVYNYAGTLIKEESIKFGYNSEENINDTFTVYHTGFLSNSNPTVKQHQIAIYNKKENSYKVAFPYAAVSKNNLLLQAAQPLQKALSRVFYYNMQTPDTIWRFNGDKIQAAFVLKFRDNAKNKISNVAALTKAPRNTSARQFFMGDYSIIKDYVFFNIVNKNRTIHPLFYSKRTGNVKYGYNSYDLKELKKLSLFNLINDIFPAGSIDGHLFYQVIEPYKLLRQEKGLNPQLLSKMNRKDKRLLDSIRETDNPILMLYELKKF